MTKKVHFMGIGGSGAKGAAELARKMGYEVTGCDLTTGGHDANHLKGIGLLIISPAVLYQNAQHPEYLEGKNRGIVMTWEEFLGKELFRDKKLIAVAGTHGKSTTTAMAAKMLTDAGLDPTVVLGATVPEWGGNYRFGRGEYALVEADEFNDNFLHYNPDIIVINNIEFDHPDYFKNEEQVRKSFDIFISHLRPGGILITEKDSLKKKFKLQVLGEHNQKNAHMVYLLGKALGIKEESIIKSLEEFKGIGRRMEYLGTTASGAEVFDDYAHHPTAIKTTLEGLKESKPGKKILAIIEPHGYKRTKVLLTLYKDAFRAADGVMIGPIFAARDKIDHTISPKEVAEISNHPTIKPFNKADELISQLSLVISQYDIVIVMGAGESSSWAREILKA